ncbi:hypothetical protein TKK_0014636 [Trichogramma kaykai]|uniref:Uncharacterized protein n=1 Tax=Trichogramma kaykai TaxID=54128 RepID=A0ABD2WCQ3_9HYME
MSQPTPSPDSPEIPAQELRRISGILGVWPAIRHVWELEKIATGRGSTTTQVPDTGVPRQRTTAETQTEATTVSNAAQTSVLPASRSNRPTATRPSPRTTRGRRPSPATPAVPAVALPAAPAPRPRLPRRRIAPIRTPYVRPPVERTLAGGPLPGPAALPVVIDLDTPPALPKHRVRTGAPRARGVPTIKADRRLKVDPKLLKELFGEDTE